MPITHAPSKHHLVSLALPEHIAILLQRAPVQLRLLPQIGCQETVTVTDRHERSFERIFERLGRAGGRCVCVLHTGELEETLDGGGGDEAGTAGGGDELCRSNISEPPQLNENVMRVDVGMDGGGKEQHSHER